MISLNFHLAFGRHAIFIAFFIKKPCLCLRRFIQFGTVGFCFLCRCTITTSSDSCIPNLLIRPWRGPRDDPEPQEMPGWGFQKPTPVSPNCAHALSPSPAIGKRLFLNEFEVQHCWKQINTAQSSPHSRQSHPHICCSNYRRGNPFLDCNIAVSRSTLLKAHHTADKATRKFAEANTRGETLF